MLESRRNTPTTRHGMARATRCHCTCVGAPEAGTARCAHACAAVHALRGSVVLPCCNTIRSDDASTAPELQFEFSEGRKRAGRQLPRSSTPTCYFNCRLGRAASRRGSPTPHVPHLHLQKPREAQRPSTHAAPSQPHAPGSNRCAWRGTRHHVWTRPTHLLARRTSGSTQQPHARWAPHAGASCMLGRRAARHACWLHKSCRTFERERVADCGAAASRTPTLRFRRAVAARRRCAYCGGAPGSRFVRHAFRVGVADRRPALTAHAHLRAPVRLCCRSPLQGASCRRRPPRPHGGGATLLPRSRAAGRTRRMRRSRRALFSPPRPGCNRQPTSTACPPASCVTAAPHTPPLLLPPAPIAPPAQAGGGARRGQLERDRARAQPLV